MPTRLQHKNHAAMQLVFVVFDLSANPVLPMQDRSSTEIHKVYVCKATEMNTNASGSNQGESEPVSGIASDHVPHTHARTLIAGAAMDREDATSA